MGNALTKRKKEKLGPKGLDGSEWCGPKLCLP